MKYRQLADTGVFVSELCLGTMTFGGRGQIWADIGGLDQKAADAIVHRALDAGINFIDTANVYATGESETMLGQALGSRRAATSSSRPRCAAAWATRPNQVGLSRLHIIEAVEASLKRLGTDYIDLYQIHRLRCAHEHRRHAARARRSGARRQGALHRLLEPAGVAADEGARRSRASSGSSASAARSRTTRSPAASSSARRFRCCRIRASACWSGARWPAASSPASSRAHGGDEAARRAKFDFPPVNKEQGVRRSSTCWARSPNARRHRGADRAGVDPGQPTP